jgi:hypothetical protein
MSFQTIKSTYECALKNERHDTVAETRYWCGQYKLMAKWAIEELERQAIAKAEKQEPAAIATGIYGGRFTYVTNTPNVVFPDGTAFYTRPQPKREPVACVIDGKLMAYKNGPLPDNCLLYDQAL